MPSPQRATTSTSVDLQHPLVQHVLRLRDRTSRDQSGSCFIEGVRFLKRAVDHGVSIQSVLLAPELLTSPTGNRMVRRLWRQGIPVVQLAAHAFRELSLLHEPQGVGAVVETRWKALRKVRANRGLCWLAASRIRSPGNLGTILRTCEAVGAAGLICIGDDVDPFHPSTVRVTMGSQFALDVVRTRADKFRDWVRREGAVVVGASPKGRVRYDQVGYRRPTVLLIGHERNGLNEQELQLCDRLVRIPMVGLVDSLNVSIAAGLLLYEIYRYREGTRR